MSSKRHHADWLSLVEVSGPFVSTPVLEKVFPQGLDAHDPDQARIQRQAYNEWQDDQESHHPTTAIHNAWIKFVLTQTLGFIDEVLAEGQAIPAGIKATIAEHGETLRPDFVVRNPEGVTDAGKPRLLIQMYPADQRLEKPIPGRHWKASPATRMMELLHATDVRLGLVTNGEQWMLVDAPRGETTGFASWYAWLWFEQSDMGFSYARSFRSLLCAHRFFSVAANETLEAILAESATHQQEVTDQLGLQVRRAVEVLIQSLDRADQDDKVLAGVPETVLYEAALTVMMRLVFLFSAEERGLLLLGDPLYDEHYAVSTLVAQLEEAAEQHGEEVLERRPDAWVRLLSTFRAVFGGVQHERMKLPAYAGNLFDPDRFPFLEGRKAGTTWRDMPADPLPVNNRTMLHVLRSLQFLELHGEARRLSFRALDIEQIGHVYEGLLDHTAKRATEPYVGLVGAKGREPEVSLAELERQRAKNEDDLVALVVEETGRSDSAVRRGLAATLEKDDAGKLLAACGHDNGLFRRVLPFGGLVRNDTFGRPAVIRKGSVFVTEGTDRRSSGTHYTPRSLTEPIVQHALEPLVYLGPAEGKPNEDWKLRSAKELLELKICDMACGSGAFLVQACRYLSELLVESWEDAEKAHPGVPGITPEGDASTGAPGETLIPKEADERLVYARRLVSQRCLYGVDKNPLAAEMAKLSLWLLTLAKDKPFTFLDHAIRAGDSLVGISNTQQLVRFSLSDDGLNMPILQEQIKKRLEAARLLRWQLEQVQDATPQDIERKAEMLKRAEEQSRRLIYAANLLLAASWLPMNDDDRMLSLKKALAEVEYKFKDLPIEQLDREGATRLHEVGCTTPFHWPLEFPEVFGDGGFDAIVSNPPFIGNKYWGARLPKHFGSWATYLVGSRMGKIDLAVLFLRRAFTLCRSSGDCGFISTRAVHEGESKPIGLGYICNNGTIYRAVTQIAWPGTAGVHVSLIWFSPCKFFKGYILDGRDVNSITADLSEYEESGAPFELHNRIFAFQGSHNGQGDCFVMDDNSPWLKRLASNTSPYLRPFATSEDFATYGPDEIPRWIVDCEDLTLGEVRQYSPITYQFLTDVAQPARTESVLAPYQGLIARWWQLWNHRANLYRLIRSHSKTCWVMPFVAKHPFVIEADNNWVFTNKLCVMRPETASLFVTLQSNIFEAWVRRHGGTMGKTRVTLTLSTCINGFPKPGVDLTEGEAICREWNLMTRSVAAEVGNGLTKIWNAFHDQENQSDCVNQIRHLRSQIDSSVACSYGWSDIDLTCGFVLRPEGMRFTISEAARREVLGRLLKLNHERYADEVRQGLHDKKGKSKKSVGRAHKSTSKATPLFDDDADDGDAADDDGPQATAEASEGSTGRNVSGDGSAKLSPRRDKGGRASAVERSAAIDELDTDEVMAAFRQAARGRGWIGREELLKQASLLLGYQRLGPRIDESLRGHLRAAIRRKIIEPDGEYVRPLTATMADYTLEELRDTLSSVMRKGTNYERDDVIQAVARHLGFARVTDHTRDALKSTLNSAIRQGILGYEGNLVWREQ